MAISFETPPKDGKPLEFLVQQVVQSVFPDVWVGHESETIKNSAGKSRPDLFVAFEESSVRQVLVEMTCSPLEFWFNEIDDPKERQLNVLKREAELKGDVEVLGIYAQHLATEGSLFSTLEILEKLGKGNLNTNEAREQIVRIARENSVYTMGVTTTVPYEEVLKGFLGLE